MDPDTDAARPTDTAVPGLAPVESEDFVSEHLIEVDGERFRVRQRARTGSLWEYHYDWLSGPNPGYGFGVGGPYELTDRDHRTEIRDFLRGIDPATGYLGD